MTATSPLLSAISSFAGGLLAWVLGVFLGKPLARLFELRLHAYLLMYDYANIANHDEQRAMKAQAELRRAAAEIDALRAVLPALCCGGLGLWGLDLMVAAGGLTGLSNSLWSHDGAKVLQRVTARRGLRLPIDSADRAVVDGRTRLEDVKT